LDQIKSISLFINSRTCLEEFGFYEFILITMEAFCMR